jgi:hypothetical protein
MEPDRDDDGAPSKRQRGGAGRSGPSQALVIAGAAVLGWLMAVDEKPWWLWLWDAVRTGFEDTSGYAVDWRLFLSVVALGVAVARWLAGRQRRKDE